MAKSPKRRTKTKKRRLRCGGAARESKSGTGSVPDRLAGRGEGAVRREAQSGTGSVPVRLTEGSAFEASAGGPLPDVEIGGAVRFMQMATSSSRLQSLFEKGRQ